ncbi:hypothetical protein LOK49_LG02G02848 [Camellia lanceoleosa]|uniref:Uncharacterized protein n=1 Tax=Camellia lanceoleosa TaxID=1840588 RepID=A0ACC0IPD4_9ERIC|nr:hypothetical protein LOK49_LG02G02848 [Camellia lanceoleosa]
MATTRSTALSQTLVRNMGGLSPSEPLPHLPTCPSMNIMLWNCRGAGNKTFRRNFKEITRTHRPEVVALFETKVLFSSMGLFFNNLGYTASTIVDPVGRVGGIWLLWNPTHVSLLIPLSLSTLLSDLSILFHLFPRCILLDMAGLSSDLGLESISLDDGDEINAEVANRCLIGKILAPKQLNKQAGPSLAVWISFKFEKLSDFCFDCGRIGHDRRGCKFVSREVDKVSGYGSELRTGIAKSNGVGGLPRHKVLNPTSPTAGACGTATLTDTSKAQARITIQGDHYRSAAHASEEGVELLEGVEVKKDSTHSRKELPDNHPAAHRGLSLSMGPSLTLSPLLYCGPGLEGQLSAGLVILEPRLMTPSRLQYFVTEPNDRPLNSSLRPILLNPYSSPIGIEEINRSSSPTRVDLKTKVLDECMSCVFNSLTLKRKAQADLEFSGKLPKLLKEAKTKQCLLLFWEMLCPSP